MTLITALCALDQLEPLALADNNPIANAIADRLGEHMAPGNCAGQGPGMPRPTHRYTYQRGQAARLR
ncbi:MAG TPA: hypothetical protein EYM51_00265 [Gammaproteobacteria bacterium]|nr:hypothetical protein [Gammaproteobacteria bacterium]